MIIPTCFEDLDWSEDAKPTSAHFLALIMAYRERASLQEPNAFPVLDGMSSPPATQPYNAISFDEVAYLINELQAQIGVLRNINQEMLAEKYHDRNGEDYLTYLVDYPYWQVTDTDFYKEDVHSKAITNLGYEYLNLQAMEASLDDNVMAHRYKEIDERALMRLLIRHKNFVGKLTEIYFQIASLGYNRPQYYINWSTNVEEDKPNSFLSAQERKYSAWSSKLGAVWHYDKGDVGDDWESERLFFECNDCDIPYIFKYPAIVSVHCWEERKTEDEYDDSWYYDFGTGLSLGWNNLGTHNLGERIPLLPKQGWGDAKATAVPPKRGQKGDYTCYWGIDLIKFDFYNSLKFKIPRGS